MRQRVSFPRFGPHVYPDHIGHVLPGPKWVGMSWCALAAALSVVFFWRAVLEVINGGSSGWELRVRYNRLRALGATRWNHINRQKRRRSGPRQGGDLS